MNRDRFLILHGVDPVRWAKRHGIEPASHPCYQCGAELRTTLPFAQGELRGLISPPCACGFEHTPYCVVHPRMHMETYLLQQAPKRQKRRKRRKLRLIWRGR